mmetsp:Transcript_3558/g.12678  ORF Transcript_3558/g.12678 Transcript_3558/m.12678 type:complete len:234 (-) Transcript_3558:219-920(-)
MAGETTLASAYAPSILSFFPMLLNASRASRANLIESRLPLLLTIVVLLLIFTPLSISKARNKAGLAALSNRLSKTAILSLPSANSGTSPTIANPRFILTNASAMLLTFSPLNTESTECINSANPAASLSVSLALSILDFTSSIFLNRSMLCFDGNSVSSNDREIFFTVFVKLSTFSSKTSISPIAVGIRFTPSCDSRSSCNEMSSPRSCKRISSSDKSRSNSTFSSVMSFALC